jgi:hypothetical protein
VGSCVARVLLGIRVSKKRESQKVAASIEKNFFIDIFSLKIVDKNN